MDSEMFSGRAAFYEYFTAAFHTTADVGFFNLTMNFVPHLAAMAEDVSQPDLTHAVARVQQFLAPGISEELLVNMSRSFVSLFLGDNTISQLESAYNPKALEELKAIYGKTFFSIPGNISEEHMASELLFMFYLAKQCADILFRGGDEAEYKKFLQMQKDFLNQHVMKWLPIVCDKVINSSLEHIVLYKELALLLKAFLELDKELLDEVEI